MLFIAILFSVLAGITLVVSRIINANLAKSIGLFQGTLINYITGLMGSVLFLIISKETLDLTNVEMGRLPFWAYLGGLLGVAVVVLSNYLTHKIPALQLTLLIFTGQLFVGILIDYFIEKKLSVGKITGGLLVLAGLAYNSMLDQKEMKKAI